MRAAIPQRLGGFLEVGPGRWMFGGVRGRRFGAPLSLLPGRVRRGCMVESSGQGALQRFAEGLHMGSLCFKFDINLRGTLALDSGGPYGHP